MNVKALILIALFLTAFLYPVMSNIVYNIVLPTINGFKVFINASGEVLPTGDDGDPIENPYFPT